VARSTGGPPAAITTGWSHAPTAHSSFCGPTAATGATGLRTATLAAAGKTDIPATAPLKEEKK
jgi:hypothetical protein